MIDQELLIFGAGSHARKLASALQKKGHTVLAFITTSQPANSEIDGTPLYSWSSRPEGLTNNRQVACGIFNRSDSYDKLADIMHSHGIENILWPWDYYPALHGELGWCYWLDAKPLTLAEWEDGRSYRELITRLADDESRTTLRRIIAFRSGADLKFASYVSKDRQYFNEVSLQCLPPGKPISFLDVGAYDGDTFDSLVGQRKVEKAILIEPDLDNFSALVKRLRIIQRDHPSLDAYALPLGAGDEQGSVRLEGEGEAASVKAADEMRNSSLERSITVARLDDMMPNESFDFIKIDVEGHDLQALKGMLDILRRSRATIAVSLYHRPRDIVELPLELITLLDGLPYIFYIRQHMYNSFESVLYAVPTRQGS